MEFGSSGFLKQAVSIRWAYKGVCQSGGSAGGGEEESLRRPIGGSTGSPSLAQLPEGTIPLGRMNPASQLSDCPTCRAGSREVRHPGPRGVQEKAHARKLVDTATENGQ
ncbi:unnamed protein product [Protopolystoma xenopodis]|uniref:Uncharacterized protein n=1 Tax=Protopolystoma xenopodis TaxID=117903 RepID=A0A3S5AN85_9PLAT|nr:unnamed protein product [Protopolystoma xenopodis]